MARRMATKPLDPDALKAADDAVDPYTGGRKIRGSQEELRKAWMDAYIKAGGQVVTTEPRGKEPDEPCENCPHKRLTVRLFSLEYRSDHRVLKNRKGDWKDKGSKYLTPHWMVGRENVISHSMVSTGTLYHAADPIKAQPDKKLTVVLQLQIGPPGAPSEAGVIVGKLGSKTMFHKKLTLIPSAKPVKVKMTSTAGVVRRIMAGKLAFEWSLASQTSYPTWTPLGTSKNEVYMTFGTPVDEGRIREDGVTLRRMKAAVHWVGRLRTNDHLKILKALFGQFDRYVLGVQTLTPTEQKELDKDPDTKKALGDEDWPSFGRNWGAWSIVDFEKWGAECQAICRLIRGILRQLGSPAKIELLHVNADFSDPETPVVRPRGSDNTGPNPDRRYELADAPVTIGRTYWPPKAGEKAEVGWNRLEAYLRFSYKDGVDKACWYGGGVGLLAEGTNPLHVFSAIAELEMVSRKITVGGNTKTQWGKKVTNAHNYPRIDFAATEP